MKRALALLIVVACNQRDGAPASAPAPISKALEIVAPPDAAAVAIAPPPDAAPPDARKRTRDDAAALQEEAARYAAALTASSDDSGITGSMSKTAPGSDLGQQILDVRDRGAQVKIGAGDSEPRRSGTGRGPALPPPSDDHKVHGRISFVSKVARDDTSLDAGAVLRKIQAAYLVGLKRCQTEQLVRDPTAIGVVTISFTVDEGGRVRDPRVTGMDDALTTCFADLARSWRFPLPKDAAGDATTARFELELRLEVD